MIHHEVIKLPGWLPKVLVRIADLAAAGRVSFTYKALRELAALPLGLDVEDVRDVLMRLTTRDSAGRRVSDVTGEWMYVFRTHVEVTLIYVKVILRSDCVVVSFHTDEGAGHDEDR
jgi:hypothetical protein